MEQKTFVYDPQQNPCLGVHAWLLKEGPLEHRKGKKADSLSSSPFMCSNVVLQDEPCPLAPTSAERCQNELSDPRRTETT